MKTQVGVKKKLREIPGSVGELFETMSGAHNGKAVNL